jgi:two-component system nitrate/nitrite response regulator NarL
VNTVVVCDTEPIATQGLRSLLESSDELRVVAAESTLADGLAAVRALTPALLILDKAFGIHSVMDVLKAARNGVQQKMAIVVWSFSFSEAEALRLLQFGASGIVRKTATLDTLLHCMRSVLAGYTWMDDDVVRESDHSLASLRGGRTPLTARELQVMELVERGFKNKDIGESLGIRTGTVKIHLKHIFEKTGIRGRYGLALSGLKEKGLLDLAAVEIAV